MKNNFYNIELDGLDYWMFEIFFVCYLTYKIFEKKIYIHKKVSVGFIIIFCLLMKIFSTLDILKNDKIRKIYKNRDYNWIIIPIGIISFILLTLLRAYSFTKTKWFFYTKYLSIIKFLLLYCFIGAILSFISSSISSLIECINIEKYPDIDLICKVQDYNSIMLYYDNFYIYFNNIWNNNDHLSINIIRVSLFIFEIILSFLSKLYSLLIIKNLNPEYFICSNSIVHFFTKIATTITSYFTEDENIKYYPKYEIIAEFFSILAIIFYLELVELKFCGLDYYLKKNITIRSLEDIKSSIDGIEETDNKNSDNTIFPDL